MMAAMNIPEFMSALGAGTNVVLNIGVIAWLSYCISTTARAADALERIADALEDDVDDEEEGGAK